MVVLEETALPRVLSQRTARRFLEARGWVQDPRGRHVVKMVNSADDRITLPMHRGNDYGARLTAEILRQAGIEGRQGR
jgi:predicted RNA binding protein YcfA (HicA-like mRNA interferase family)